MDVDVNVNELKDVLTRLSVLTRRKTTLPITSSVFISADSGTMAITATDLETTATLSLPIASVGEPWKRTIDCKRLLDVIKSKKGDVRIACDTEIIRIGDTNTLPCGDPDDFPLALATTPATTQSSIHAEVLCGMIDRLSPITNEWSDKRDSVLGMGLCIEGGNIRLISNDSKRIATSWQGRLGYEVKAIIPKSGMIAASKILAKSKDTVHMELTDTLISLQTPTTHIHIQRLDGDYPDCSEILEVESNYKLVLVARKPLLSALKSAAALWPTKDKDILPVMALTVTRDTLTIQSENRDTGGFTETIPFEGATDGAFDNKYNIRYLIDAVNAVTSDTVRMYVGGENDPTYIVDDNFKTAVMPLRRE